MALLLNEYGVEFRLVEKNQEPQIQTKAAGLWSRSLEALEHLGLAEKFLQKAQIAHGGRFYVDGELAMTLGLRRIPSRYNFLTLIPQHETEALLTLELTRRGVEVERGTQLKSWDGECAVLESSRGTETVKPRFLFGCDGARSSVRQECGLAFQGSTFEGVWLVGDMGVEGPPLNSREITLFLGPDGPMAFFPLGQSRYRVVAFAGEDFTRRDTPTLEDFQSYTKRRVPFEVALSEGRHLTVFTIHERQVEHYRSGRAFLLGDAAHIHSPAGGQGLNTGLQDAFNLAWKVAHVVRWEAPEGLLDTYSRERHPIAAKVLAGSTIATRMASVKNPMARAVRRAALSVASQLEPLLDKVRETVSETDIHYRGSSLCGTHAVGRLKPGERIPELRWSDQKGQIQRLQSLFKGPGWSLLCFGGGEPDWGSEQIRPVSLPLHSPMAEELGLDEGGWLLVRPDGYLAASFPPGDNLAVEDYMRSHCGAKLQSERTQSAQFH